MKYKVYELDAEEKELLEAYERGDFLPVENPSAMKKATEKAASNTVSKRKNINIRISTQDLQRLKVKALEEGLPYQTLAGSILHKHVAAP